ncbi:MAG: molecular chaperone TorD family protein [Pseudomonadota bacterium]
MILAEKTAEFEIAAEELLRADLYDMLGALLARPPTPELLAMVKGLSGDASSLGQGISAMARLASQLKPAAIEAEFNTLFIGLTRGELLPYASYYMTGFLHEKPLAVLRTEMARLQIERAPNVFEPEDNIASLCEMMAGLIRGRFGRIADLGTQRDFFSAHVAPWAGHFFSDLEAAKASVFFAPVGTIGKAFMEIEREAFRMGV